MRAVALMLAAAVAWAGAECPVAAQQAPPVSSRMQAPSSSPFLGGVPSGTATSQMLTLSVGDAINRALAHNLGVLEAEAGVDRARGARWIALSEMLPNVNGHVSETRQVVNLAAFGFPLPPGIPPIVGPFNVFDARVNLSQSIFDLRAINDVRSDRHNLAAQQYSYQSARELVVLVTANLYLQAVAANARAIAAKAQLATAQALYNQAVDLKNSGMIPGINVLRAQVEMSTQQQRTTRTQNDAEQAKLQLARVVGLPIGQNFTVSELLPDVPVPDITLEQAVNRAYDARPDYQAAMERVRAAEAAVAAARGEWMPSVHFNADYGDLGLTVADSHYTYSLSGVLAVPIFNGGRTRGRLVQAEADLRNRRSEAEDAKAAVYYDVRTAFLDMQAGREQLQVAASARDLAGQQLGQARDRFAAGVADNLEVVQAQEAVAVANEQYIAAEYSFNLAKAELARALGVAEQAVKQYLGGSN